MSAEASSFHTINAPRREGLLRKHHPMPLEQTEDGIPHMHADPRCTQSVGLAGIECHLEQRRILLQLRDQRRTVLEHHVVVRHSVNQRQRVHGPLGLLQCVGLTVCVGNFARVAYVALGIVSAVEIPFCHRSSGDADCIEALVGLKHFKRHVTAVEPAMDGDLVGINKIERLEILGTDTLGGDLYDAYGLAYLRFICHAPVSATAIIDPMVDIALVDDCLYLHTFPTAHDSLAVWVAVVFGT
jgi:hypothetical protein